MAPGTAGGGEKCRALCRKKKKRRSSKSNEYEGGGGVDLCAKVTSDDFRR